LRTNRFLHSLVLLVTLSGSAQVLARPGWAGSGVAPEAWWRRAVFYRIDPARFQDSNGDGAGDLQGIAQRLDYLQSLGVDGVVLDGNVDPDGLDDLIREASRAHLRLLVTVTPAMAQGPRDALLAKVHEWLSAGAAGVWVPKAGESNAADGSYAAVLTSLRSLIQTFPGERVLLTDPAPVAVSLAPRPVRLTRRIDPGSFNAARGGVLTTAATFPVGSSGVGALRAALTAASEGNSPESNPLLCFGADPVTGSPNAAADAALLLASRGAALFDSGDEIGLDLFPVRSAAPGTEMSLPVMQWTPSNRTPAPKDETEGATTASKPAEEFGAYHPYQPPPRGLRGPTGASAKVVPDPNVAEALPDPDSLPGYTTGTLPAQPVEGPRLNVTVEDRDPGSLLNAYRQLIGLHHDNATLRNGTQYVLNRDADGALVWIRRAPAGSRTVANVVVAANLSDKPVVLSLDADILALGMRPGALRPLMAYSQEALTGENTAHLALPAHAVFLGEIFHGGAEPADRAPHAGRRSRHRVRR